MWYWTVNTPIRPPSELPTPLSWPPSIIHTTVRGQYFNQNTTNTWKDFRLGNLLIRSSLILGGVWSTEGVSRQNKNGGESQQKGPLFPPRPFSPWPPRRWWWWFCFRNRNTIDSKMEIHLMSDGNKKRDNKLHSFIRYNVPLTVSNNGDNDPTKKSTKW